MPQSRIRLLRAAGVLLIVSLGAGLSGCGCQSRQGSADLTARAEVFAREEAADRAFREGRYEDAAEQLESLWLEGAAGERRPRGPWPYMIAVKAARVAERWSPARDRFELIALEWETRAVRIDATDNERRSWLWLAHGLRLNGSAVRVAGHAHSSDPALWKWLRDDRWRRDVLVQMVLEEGELQLASDLRPDAATRVVEGAGDAGMKMLLPVGVILGPLIAPR